MVLLEILVTFACLHKTVGQVATSGDCDSASTETYANGRCYELIESTGISYLSAQASCAAKPFSRARLATVNNQNEFDIVQDLLSDNSYTDPAFVGLHTPDGVWLQQNFGGTKFYSDYSEDAPDVNFLSTKSATDQGRCFSLDTNTNNPLTSSTSASLSTCATNDAYVCEFGADQPDCPSMCDDCTWVENDANYHCNSCDGGKLLFESSEGPRCIAHIWCKDADADGNYFVNSGPYEGDECDCEDTNARTCKIMASGQESKKCHDGTSVSGSCTPSGCPCDNHGV